MKKYFWKYFDKKVGKWKRFSGYFSKEMRSEEPEKTIKMNKIEDNVEDKNGI